MGIKAIVADAIHPKAAEIRAISDDFELAQYVGRVIEEAAMRTHVAVVGPGQASPEEIAQAVADDLGDPCEGGEYVEDIYIEALTEAVRRARK